VPEHALFANRDPQLLGLIWLLVFASTTQRSQVPATPARRPPHAPQFSPPHQPSRTALERRRRSQHFARLRRDVLEDTAVALLVTLLTIAFTSGLGVIALIELPLVLALIISYLLERRTRRRRGRPRPQTRTPRSMKANADSDPGHRT
jgi:hypothetical protein